MLPECPAHRVDGSGGNPRPAPRARSSTHGAHPDGRATSASTRVVARGSMGSGVVQLDSRRVQTFQLRRDGVEKLNALNPRRATPFARQTTPARGAYTEVFAAGLRALVRHAGHFIKSGAVVRAEFPKTERFQPAPAAPGRDKSGSPDSRTLRRLEQPQDHRPEVQRGVPTGRSAQLGRIAA